MSVMPYERMKYGLFVHYIASMTMDEKGVKTPDINEAADGFDVAAFTASVVKMKVEYVIFTAWHYLAQPLYPSAVTEKWRPGNSTRRDLVGEIIDSLSAAGVRVILYTHPRDGHDFGPEDRKRTGWSAGYDHDVPYSGVDTPDFPDFDFEKWNAYTTELYSELLSRYGSRIDGIWLDGMGPGRFMYGAIGCQSYEYPIVDYLALRTIIKNANPNAAIIHNMNGERYNCDFVMPEGYYGVENTIPVGDWPACEKALAFCPFTGWSPAEAKGESVVKFSADDIFVFTVFEATCASAGGCCFAASPYRGGEWETGVVEEMSDIGDSITALGASLRDIVPSTSYPTVSGDTLNSRGYICACTSRDRAYEYIHILRRPADGRVVLPAPADGASFARPQIVAGGAGIVGYDITSGIEITLTGGESARDIVLRLDRIGEAGAPRVSWLNDTEGEIVYSGVWEYSCFCPRNMFCLGMYEYDEHAAADDGAWLQFTAECDRVEIYGAVGPDLGCGDLLIDGMKAGTINEKAEEYQNRRLLFTSDNLYGGRHTVRIVKTGGKKLSFDAAKIIRC